MMNIFIAERKISNHQRGLFDAINYPMIYLIRISIMMLIYSYQLYIKTIFTF